jgi:hypothetical protein
LFGFGFGEVYDSFVELTTQVGVQHHYDQIKYSSGVGHYVSWGFHNNIVRMFLFFGLAGFLLLFAWQVSLFYAGKNKTPIHIFQLKTVLKVIFILTLLLSFSNGIYSTTLTACFLFSIQGLLYGEIRYLTKMSLVQ